MLDAQSDSRPKRRASQACCACRARKVKCDLSSFTAPCSNCREDEVECTLAESRRSRKYRQAKRCTESHPNFPAPAQTSPPHHTSVQTPWEFTPRTHFESITTAAGGRPTKTVQSLPPSQHPISLPPYIRNGRMKISDEDLNFLAARGALTIPEASLRDELLLAFVLYVHPYLPVVSVQDLLDSVYLQPGADQYSLLLFQAIMFSGAAHIDMRSLHNLGFQTRRAARKAFYLKVKLLYDFGWEKDRLAVIQALLITNYWYVSPEDQKDPWHQVGICLALGTSIGLGDKSQHLNLPVKTRRIWRRTWWSCILRDRVVALTTRKPLHVHEDDIVIPLLSLEDFELEPISSTVAALLGSTLLCDSDTRTTLARLCIEKVKLSLFVARTMAKTYKLISHSIEPTDFVVLYTARRDRVALSEAIRIHHDLEQWQSSLPAVCGYDTHPHQDFVDGSSLMVHRASLRQLSTILQAMLYRPFLKARINSPSFDPFLTDTVRPTMRKMVSEVSAMAGILHNRDMIRFLLPMSVTYFLPTLFTLIVEIKHSRDTLRDQLETQFRECNQALLQLRKIYHIADSACVLIEYLMSKGPNPSTSTSAAFLEHEQSPSQNPTRATSPRLLESDRTDTSGTNGYSEDGIHGQIQPATPLPHDALLWSDLEPWFNQDGTPISDLLWMDLALEDYEGMTGMTDSIGFEL